MILEFGAKSCLESLGVSVSQISSLVEGLVEFEISSLRGLRPSRVILEKSSQVSGLSLSVIQRLVLILSHGGSL